MQVAEEAYPLLQRRPPANRLREHRNSHAHEEVVVVGGAARHGRPQVTQEGCVGSVGEGGKTWLGWEGKIMDGQRGGGSSTVWHHGGDWNTAAPDPGAWYSTVRVTGAVGLWPRG